MPKVFINYRAQEQAGYAALLDRELSRRFGRDAVFRASRSVQPGSDFADEITHNLRRCAVLLAVIGPRWSATTSTSGSVEGDWVHREIAEALAHHVRVIPILVEDAALPEWSSLPPDIAALAKCQYLRLHHRSVERDLAQVADELVRLVPELARTNADSGGRRYRLAGPAHSPCQIGVIAGSIRRVRCADIWVNSENTDMEMSRITEFSVSGIIRYYGARRDEAGRVTADLIADELAAKVGDRRPVAAGTAIVTGAGQLLGSHNVHYIVHVAAVHGEPGAGFRQVRIVDRCVTAALTEAERLAGDAQPVRTILFPLLGTGVAGAEAKPTVSVLLDAAVDYLLATPDTRLRAIYFLAYTPDELDAFEDVLRRSVWLVPVAGSAATPGHRADRPQSTLPRPSDRPTATTTAGERA
jgi:O-acetyl-ADP-ribose deacetylase (regulator of RNase III)